MKWGYFPFTWPWHFTLLEPDSEDLESQPLHTPEDVSEGGTQNMPVGSGVQVFPSGISLHTAAQ